MATLAKVLSFRRGFGTRDEGFLRGAGTKTRGYGEWGGLAKDGGMYVDMATGGCGFGKWE